MEIVQVGGKTRMRGKVDGVSYSIELTRTDCHFGGYRRWFVCPFCDCRRAILYLSTQGFICRICADLTYVTQRMNLEDRKLRRKRKILARLGLNGDPIGKPLWMRQKTFQALTFELLLLDAWFIHKVIDPIIEQNRLNVVAELVEREEEMHDPES